MAQRILDVGHEQFLVLLFVVEAQNNQVPEGRHLCFKLMHITLMRLIGGINASDMNDVQYATIKTDGSVGEWNTTTSFTTARDAHASVAYNGYLYLVGGFGATNLNDVQFTPLLTTSFKARYERFFDTTSAGNTINSFVINGVAKCSYTVTYKTAGSSGIFGAATILINVFPGVSQTITTASQRYVAFVVTLDDSTCGGQSTITDMQLTYNAAPDAPTLIQPANSTLNVNILPEFRLGTTDDSNDYIRYKIDVCSISDCSVIVRTIDETVSQTGWLSQSQQSATAYSGGAVITQLAIHQYQAAALSGSTQYWWRAYAIDPGGSNQLSAASAISTFTTGATLQSNININGNTKIYGGSTLQH